MKKILPIIIVLVLIIAGVILGVKFPRKRPAEEATEKPIEKPAEEPTKKPAEEPTEKLIEKLAEKSLMDLVKEQGQEILSKNEYISECEKSSGQESKDTCYYYAAFLYRDAGLCKKIQKDAELKKICTKENIEKWYQDLEEGKVRPMGPEISGVPGSLTIPGSPGPGGSLLEEMKYKAGEEEEIEEPISTGKMNDDIYVEIEGYTYYLAMLYVENPAAAIEKAEKIEAERNKLLKKYGVTNKQVEAYGNKIFEEAEKGNIDRMVRIAERLQARAAELKEKGL